MRITWREEEKEEEGENSPTAAAANPTASPGVHGRRLVDIAGTGPGGAATTELQAPVTIGPARGEGGNCECSDL